MAARQPPRITKNAPESLSGTGRATFRYLAPCPALAAEARCVTFPSRSCQTGCCASTTKARLNTAAMNSVRSCTLRPEQSIVVVAQAGGERDLPAQAGSGPFRPGSSLVSTVGSADALLQTECRRRFAGMPILGTDGERAGDGSSATLRRQVVTRSWVVGGPP